jgi:outer membrane protein OmpA-like peptidoglycan-associated protein
MSAEYAILGTFKGRFKTNQATALGLSDTFPKDLAHKVQVYSGSLRDNSFEEDFQPDHYRKLSSFLFINVPNIEVQGNNTAPFPDKRVYTFTELILIDPKITRTYELNGQTYGEIEGKAYGKTAPTPEIDKADPPPLKEEDDQGSSGISSTDFNDESEIGRTINELQTGCASGLAGCLANLWKILGLILLILFLLWLLKSCNELANDDGSCDRLEEHKIQLIDQKRIKDSLEHVYEENIRKNLANIKNVYFYQNTDEIHEYSLNEERGEGNLIRLTKLIQVCNDKSFKIIGHHSGKDIEGRQNLDKLRAIAVKEYFIANGIDPSRLHVVAKGDSAAYYSDSLSKYVFNEYEENHFRKYNRNMRVTVKLMKKK